MTTKAKAQHFQTLATLVGGFALCQPISDPDLWWHLTVGRWILSHHRLPTEDLWNLFGSGLPWQAYSWSNEVVFAWVYALGAEPALGLLKLIFSLALSGALIGCFVSISKDRFFGSCLGIITLAGTSDNFSLRPQSLSWIFLVLTIYLVHYLAERGLSLRPLVFLAAIMVLWANSHLTTVFGIAIAFVWMAQKAQATTIKPALIVTGVALCSTLCTPYFGGEWMITQRKALHPILHQSIQEFQPATIFHYNAGILVVMFVLLLALLQRQPKSLEVPRVLFCALFFIIALTAVKWIPYALIITCASISCAWSRGSPALFGNLGKQVELFRSFIFKLPTSLFVVLAFVPVTRSAIILYVTPVRENYFPVHAVDYILKHRLPHPVLNAFGDGGYLMFRFSDSDGNPLNRVPIDGRTNVNTAEVMSAHEAAFLGTKHWKRYLELVNPGTVLWEDGLPLSSVLEIHSDWCRVYSDPLTDGKHQSRSWEIFVRKDRLPELSPAVTPAECSASAMSPT